MGMIMMLLMMMIMMSEVQKLAIYNAGGRPNHMGKNDDDDDDDDGDDDDDVDDYDCCPDEYHSSQVKVVNHQFFFSPTFCFNGINIFYQRLHLAASSSLLLLALDFSGGIMRYCTTICYSQH